MKKSIILFLVVLMAFTAFSSVFAEEITVVTSYGGDDGNRSNYEAAVKAYEDATGNKVNDESATSNEEWKAKIMTDFETGAEPDVLFFFNGVDSNPLIEAGKIVSVDEIRETYPDYASNMKDGMLGASPVDGKNYSIPVNGYWEGLFVNKNVLEAAGVEVPGAGYSWDQFLADCEKIKEAGYTPVAVSLQEVPHYWFEFTVFNHGTAANHLDLPASSADEAGQKWVAGFEDIKTLYEKGYLPANTLTATDAETFQMMADDKAAFAIDGSWKIGWFQSNVADINDYTVTYVPGNGDRAATDIIGGLSMGYFIPRKSWDDPEKQQACVDFIGMMTSDDVVSTFGATAVTALKNGTTPPADADALVTAALEMTKGSTAIAPAVQDKLSSEARADLFANIKNIVTGKITAAEAVDAALALN
ncbi:MAG: ABC transporter substrate-binding protein [Flexilinea sp.]